jgi:hypothetical protein
MGFFDKFGSKKSEPSPSPAPAQAPTAPTSGGVVNVKPRLLAAREKLALQDLPAALAIYEELLATGGDRADVLVAISGDLGTHGHVAQIIELIAPRYDAERHGPATGLNILQAYLTVRDADAAQHVLDILFALQRPELEDRLHGFSNVIGEMIQDRHSPLDPGAVMQIAEVAKVSLITISKPIWFYGLEAMADEVLPSKEGRLRRVAFAQFALVEGYENLNAALAKPEDELGRLSRAIPLWFAETFYFGAPYVASAALGVITQPHGAGAQPMIFNTEWTTENLRQLLNTAGEDIDYIFTGALRRDGLETELVLRVWEVKKLRERKTFSIRWNVANAEVELAKLHEEVRTFMEWSATDEGLPYSPPPRPTAWLDLLGASVGLFLVEKTILKPDQLASPAEDLRRAAQTANTSEAASLAYLTLLARARKLGTPAPDQIALFDAPSVRQAFEILA